MRPRVLLLQSAKHQAQLIVGAYGRSMAETHANERMRKFAESDYIKSLWWAVVLAEITAAQCAGESE